MQRKTWRMRNQGLFEKRIQGGLKWSLCHFRASQKANMPKEQSLFNLTGSSRKPHSQSVPSYHLIQRSLRANLNPTPTPTPSLNLTLSLTLILTLTLTTVWSFVSIRDNSEGTFQLSLQDWLMPLLDMPLILTSSSQYCPLTHSWIFLAESAPTPSKFLHTNDHFRVCF